METVKRFRLFAVRTALFITMALGLGIFKFNPVLSKGILAGGMAGVLAFWIIAYRVEQLAKAASGAVKSSAYRWTVLQMALYASALVWSYRLDPDSLLGILGAGIGLFIIQVVVFVLGLTGLDLKKERETDGEHR